jgi:metal-dependent amidase/aminoacylase/carboxypeptidase family protein
LYHAFIPKPIFLAIAESGQNLFFTILKAATPQIITMKKQQILFLIMLCMLFAVGSKTVQAQQITPEMLTTETDKVFDKLVKLRRQIHQNPELAGKEKQTQAAIKQYLLDLGLEVKTNTYGYGVVGILQGSKKGKKIAWRADMDALPNDFADKAEFRSKVQGVQHGCGHDVHIAIGLGIAEVLAKHKKTLQGTVYFIFQPEEETFVGAKNMVNKGLFSAIKPAEIYGLHVTPFPVGQIIAKPRELFAYQRRVSITLKEMLSLEAVATLKTNLKTKLARNLTDKKPWDLQNLLDPQAGLASPASIFKDYLFVDDNYFSAYEKDKQQVVEFYVYETDAQKIAEIIPTVGQVLTQQGLDKQLLRIKFVQDNPTVMNNEKLNTAAVQILQNAFGNGAVVPIFGQVPFSNDDFAYFQQKISGVYFFLGASNFEKGIIAMIHAPNFEVDEECIRVGVKSFSTLLLNRLAA